MDPKRRMDPNHLAGQHWASFQELMQEVQDALAEEGRRHLFDDAFREAFAYHLDDHNVETENYPIEIFCWNLFRDIYNYFWPGTPIQEWDIPQEVLEANQMRVNAALWLRFHGNVEERTVQELIDYISFIEATLYAMLEMRDLLRYLREQQIQGTLHSFNLLSILVLIYFSWMRVQISGTTPPMRPTRGITNLGLTRLVLIGHLFFSLRVLDRALRRR
ncbi:hypothetical protein F5Y13DRAFT_195525 [Hypoxylon sp. FL1857]|nr:hypothetical protein F5Y13DRAFT_195525 [Hypoxylon sp. FL1857]